MVVELYISVKILKLLYKMKETKTYFRSFGSYKVSR